MAKKNKFIYDPEYWRKYGNIGESISQSNLEDLAAQRRSILTHIPDDVQSYDYFSEYEPEQENGEDSGFWSEVGRAVTLPIMASANLPATAAMLVEKSMQGFANRYKSEAADDSYSISTLQDLQRFLELKDQRNEIIKRRQYSIENGDNVGVQLADNALIQFHQEHPEYERYALTLKDEIRKNTKIQDLLYDVTGDKAVSHTVLNNMLSQGLPTASDYMIAQANGPLAVGWETLKGMGNAILNTFNVAGGQLIGNTVNASKQAVTGENMPTYYEESVRNAIAGDGVLSDDQMQSLQKYNLDNMTATQTAALRKNIDDRIQYLERNAAENRADYAEKLNQIKSGTWYYNPELISDKYRERQENNKGIFTSWNPVDWAENVYYNIPELGSSFSDIAAFLTTVGAQQVGGRLGGMLMSKGHPIAAGITTAASAIVGVGATIQGRESETAQESIDAWVSRLHSNLEHLNMNTPDLYDELSTKLQEYGVDTADMDQSEILGTALAYNIKSRDDRYNQLVKESHKGLKGLVERNNALSTMDYLQALPYIGSTPKMLSRYATELSRAIRPLNSMRYTNSLYRDAAEEIAERSVADAVKSSAVRTWIDKRIDNIVRRGGADIATQVARRNMYSKVGKKAARDIGVALSEGVEEGQQSYIAHMYENGVYDDETSYSWGPSMNLKALSDDTRLAFDAVLSYFGLNFGDPLNGDDELRAAMESGAATGFFFPMAGNVLSNIRGRNEYSLRRMTKDFRNDKMLIRTIGENYGKQAIDAQTDALFEAYKNGMTADKAAKAFETAKRYLNPQRVSSEDMEFAKKVATASYEAYRTSMSKDNDVLGKLNISPNSEDHKDFVKLATESVMDLDDIRNKQGIVSRDIEGTINQIKRALGDPEEMSKIPGLTAFDRRLRQRYNTMRNRHAKYMEEADAIEKKIPEKQKRGINTNEDENRAQALRDKAGIVPSTYEEIRDDLINVAFLDAQMRVLYNLSKQTESQEDRLKQIRKLSGTLINTTNLNQINKRLKERRDQIAKQYSKLLNDAATSLSIAGNAKTRRNSVEQLFNQYGFYNTNQGLKDAIEIEALNAALMQIYEDKADVFTHNMINPTRAKYLISRVKYSDLSDEQKAAFESQYRREHPDEKSTDYEKAWNKEQEETLEELKKYERQAFIDRTDEDATDEERLENLREIYQNAAIAVMRSEMAHRSTRKRILSDYHEQSRPLNADDIDKAEEGDAKSQAKVEQTASQPENAPEPPIPNIGAPKQQAEELGKKVDQMKQRMGYTGSEPDKHTETPPSARQVKSDQGKIKGPKAQTAIDELTEQELANLFLEPEQSVFKQEQIEADSQPEITRQPAGQRNPETVPETQQPKDDHKEDPISNQKNDDVSHETNQPKAEPNSKLEDIPEDAWKSILPTADELDAYVDELATAQADKLAEDVMREVNDEMLAYLDQLEYEQDEISQQRKMEQVVKPTRKRTGTAFNYRPDGLVPMELKGPNGKLLNFGKGVKIGIGSELNAKLSTPGWFTKERAAQCFYFVSWPGKGQLGVHMAIPDGNTLYIVSLPDENTLSNYDTKTAASIRQMREDIINKYLPLYIDAGVVVKTLKPASISISNGRFNNIERGRVPQYRSILGENAGFGLSDDISELSDQLDNPNSTGIMFYVGRSMLSDFAITNIYDNDTVPGAVGVPGKIYISVPAQSRPGYNMKQDGTPTLLTLHEHRFTEDPETERASTPDELSAAASRLQEHFDSNGNLTGTPTMGELILRLLAYKGGLRHMFSNNVLPGPAFKDQFVNIIANMIVNHGKFTMLPNDKPRNYPGWLINKQLDVTNENGQVWLHIGNAGTTVVDGVVHRMIDDVDRLTGGNRWIARQQYTGASVLSVNLNELFKPENEVLRKRIIAQINNSFHWNTELFSSDNETSMLDAIKAEFLTYLDTNKLWAPGQTIRLFNNPNLEFNYDDFHDNTGKRRTIKETTLLAWMLKTGKLTTNAGTNSSDMFTAPFVFPTGVNTVSTNDNTQVAKEVAQAKKKSKTKSKVLTTDFTEWLNSKEHIGSIPQDQRSLVIDTDLFTKTNGKVASKVVLWVDPVIELEDFKNEVRRKAEEIIPELIADFKQKHPDLKLNEKPLYAIPYGPDGGGNQCPDGLGHPCVTIRLVKGKEFRICIDSLSHTNGMIKKVIGTSSTNNYITGVYSRVRGKGHIDTTKSRTWLQNTLGLSEDQVVVTSAFSRALSSLKAYAVTNLAVDAITNEVFGRIILGEEGGLGEEYHEAWHYVNLLLHNKSSRQKMYEEWRKHHSEDQDATDEEIEEHMAEDFRDYMMRYDNNKRSNRVLRFFRNMYTFLRTYITRGRQISKIYQAIRNGEYKGDKLDSESVREFAKAYPNGVAFTIPGVSQNETNNFKYIKDFRTYYAVTQSLTNLILGGLNIKNIRDVQSVTGEKITRIVREAYEQIENDEYLEDVLNHPKAFQSAITKAFEQLGLRVVNTKKNKLDKDHEEGKDSGDVSDNIWDIDHLEVSRKNNVSFRAKLFFSTIPNRIKSIDNGVITYETVQDDYTGATQFVTFAETWNKIMEDLSECDSFDDIDSDTGDYMSSSIMYNVRRLANVDSFYAYVYDQLNRLNSDTNSGDDARRNIALETKIQIFNTIVGTKADIDVIDIDNPAPTRTAGMEEDMSLQDMSMDMDMEEDTATQPVQSDTEKQWSIRDSLYLQSRFRLPRRWSNNFATSTGAVVSDANGQRVSNEWKTQEATIRQKMFNAISLGDVVQTRLYLCNLLQHWGIPVDELVIDNYSNTFNDGNVIATAQELYGNPKSTASISFFETQIRGLSGNNTMLGKNHDKPIDTIFNSYGKASELPISRLAVAYSRVHPSSSEFSVTSPEGSILYPFTNNNFATDRTRDINNDRALIVERMRNCSQCAHSLILQAADINLSTGTTDRNKLIRLKTFVGVKDNTQVEGADYFGITPLEDYVSKLVLTFNKRLIDPTMADKKGYYSIASDTLSSLIPRIAVEGFGKTRASFEGVRHIFAGYINDELNTLLDYYNQNSIQRVLNKPNSRLVNYHGEIGTYPGTDIQYYAFGGNGGMFRYYYNLPIEFAKHVAQEFNLDETQLQKLNMNQLMELLWNIEHTQNELSVSVGETPTDGFDNIRRMLNLYQEWFGFTSNPNSENTQHCNDMIDDILTQMVNSEIDYLSTSEDVRLINKESSGLFNKSIPNDILNKYYEMLAGIPGVDNNNILSNAVYSAVANHVIMQAISIQEIEKIYSGDPAMYKWVYYKDLPEDKRVTYTYTDDLGKQHEWNLKVLDQKDVDKTKRLGGILSPGTNLKSVFSEQEIINAHGMLDDFGTSKYTFMNIADIKAKSAYIEDLGQAFKREWIYQYYNQNRTKKVELERIFSDSEYAQSLFEKLTPEQQSTINKNVEDSLGPYKSITVGDAEVVIRPAMYRKLRIGMGEWTFQPDETGYSDEIAYNLIEKDASWMTDPEKVKIVRKLQLKPLKMSYFGNDISSEFPNLVTPVYNKMAMFPLFKYVATSDTGRKLYERMNTKDNEIDMIGFESAVKVGCNQGMYRPNAKGSVDISFIDESIDRPSSASINYRTGQVNGNFDKNALTVQVQDLNNLHLQLNTDAHEDTERSLGTQMAKIAMCNVIDNMMYGDRTGAEIRQDIIDVINAMTYKGREDVFKRFFRFNPRTKRYDLPNHDAIRDFLLDVAISNGMDSATQRILSNGGTISSLSSRKLFEQAVCSMINSNIVDINTFGGSAVQQSIFGFTGLRKDQVREWDPNNPQYQELNNGEDPKWVVYENDGHTIKGHMQVFLSMRFFRHVLPKDMYERGDYNEMRKWLFDNNIIGNNSEPFGVGYRIPTQGPSSIFAYQVADVLPDMQGDTIIVPKEFTAQTGSDFDVDKIYIASFAYQIDKETGKPYRPTISAPESSETSAYDHYKTQSFNALRNRLLQNYLDIIMDQKNLSNARASIDTLTDIMKKDLVPAIRVKSYETPYSGYELLPSFQSSRKNEYILGKQDLAIFALNTTGHSMTQLTHLRINQNIIERIYKFGQPSDITGKDGYKISDWLSAMVSAHADVAKDPFIFTLNVNKVTATTTAYLLRSGMGASTFTFLAQPIIRTYASRVTSKNGMYGVGEKDKTIKKSTRNQLKQEYWQKFSNVMTILQDHKYLVDEFYEDMLKFGDVGGYLNGLYADIISGEEPMRHFLDVFNVNYAKSVINPVIVNKESTDETLYRAAKHYAHQLITMYVYEALQPHVEILSNLVTQSRIDTKKFGNNITSQLNFINGYYDFKFDEEKNAQVWIPQPFRRVWKEENMALYDFFDGTFLDKKLQYATRTLRQILANQSFTATNFYEKVYNAVMRELFGYNIKQGILPNGQKILFNGYAPVLNDDTVQHIGNIIDTIIRHKAMVYQASKSQLKDAPTFVDFTFGNDRTERISKLRELITGGKFGSVPRRLASAKWYITNRYNQYRQLNLPIPDYLQLLCNPDGSIRNEFLNWVSYQNGKIDRIILSDSQMNVDGQFKDKAYSAFQELLELTTTSKEEFDQNMVKSINQLAKDLILYSYYTTYNNNTTNSFFDVVPIEYRGQYDGSISKTLRNYRGQQEQDFIDFILGGNQLDKANFDGFDFTSLIIRNLWYDDSIIAPYGAVMPVHSKGVSVLPNGRVYASYDDVFNNVQGIGQQIGTGNDITGSTLNPILVIPQRECRGQKWIKIKDKSGEYQIYRRIGKMVFKSPSVSDNVNHPSDLITKYVYQITPKLGHIERGYNIPEWFSNGLGQSIFDENVLNVQIPTDAEINTQAGFNESDVLAFISKINAKKLLNKESNPKYNRLVFVRDDQIFNSPTPSSVTNPTEPSNSTSQNDVQSTPEVDEVAKDLSKAQDDMMDKYDKQQFELDKKIQDAVNAVSGVVGENISSRGSEFARMLTNPGNNITVEYKGKVFRNAEHAYQTWKSGEFDEVAFNSTAFKPVDIKPVNKTTSFQTMVDILTAKLQQHPELIQGINERGGIEYLNKSWHSVTGDAFWETQGNFMNALKQAYLAVQQSGGFNVMSISNRTDDFGVQIDPKIRYNYAKWLKNNPDGIVAYRINVNTFNTPEAVREGIIGNPFDWQKYGEQRSLQMFYDWLTTGNNFGEQKASGAFRQAIINKILNSPEGTPILYYKEKNQPSHATMIGYLINNKYLLDQPVKISTTTTKNYRDRTIKNVRDTDLTLALVIDKTTLGEKLTKNVAAEQGKYNLINITVDDRGMYHFDQNDVQRVIDKYADKGPLRINIAGNGIYTFKNYSESKIEGYQGQLDLDVEYLLQQLVNAGVDISYVRSGGQTGVDEAGVKAASKLHIPSEIVTTSDFKFRNIDNLDISDEAEFKARFNTLKNDMYTQARESQQPTQSVQRDLFANDPVFDHLSDKEKEQGKQFKDYCKGE